MLKKFALAIALFALPLGAMAQQKFAHMNSQEVITVMPEFTKAQADLDALAKQYQKEMETGEAELNKKYQEFLQQADSLPQNIAERRQKEIQDMAQRQQQFQQEAAQAMQKAQTDAMAPIYKKLDEAIQAVEGWTLSDDQTTLTKVFSENTDGSVTISDLAGNTAVVNYTVSGIESDQPGEGVDNPNQDDENTPPKEEDGDNTASDQEDADTAAVDSTGMFAMMLMISAGVVALLQKRRKEE